LIAYQTAYLKANYPVEFIASMMTYDLNNTDKLGIGREELMRLKIPLLSPDVNHSFARFSVEKRDDTFGVRYALAALKNVGESAIDLMAAEREAHGPFLDIIDFARRLDSKAINKRMLENLIASGAFDSLDPNRAKLYGNIDLILKHVGEKAAQQNSNQHSLFGGGGDSAVDLPPVVLAEVRPWGRAERAQKEFDAVGFYLTEHPVDSYGDMLKKCNVKTYAELRNTDFGSGELAVNLAGVVVSKKERLSKKGNKFAFIQFSDATGFYEGVLFAEAYTNCKDLIEPGTAVLIKALAKREDEEVRFVIQSLSRLEDSAAAASKLLSMTVTDSKALAHVKEVLLKSGVGSARVELTLRCENYESLINLAERYKITPATLDNLSVIGHLRQIKVA